MTERESKGVNVISNVQSEQFLISLFFDKEKQLRSEDAYASTDL